jgi:hypothetical protein
MTGPFHREDSPAPDWPRRRPATARISASLQGHGAFSGDGLPRQLEDTVLPPFAEDAAAGAARLVILIERCSEVQVGRDNDQYHAFRYTLPAAAIKSGQALAEDLLQPGTPWARDVFSYDIALEQVRALSHGRGNPVSGSLPAAGGEILVIVRNSSNVQVGDHNVQHNEFRIRVPPVTVQACQLRATPEREQAIAQLREDPYDQKAAHELAQDIARAARDELVVDLTAKVTVALGDRKIEGFPASVCDRAGYSLGENNRVHMTVEVTAVRVFNTQALEKQFLRAAELGNPGTGPDELPGPVRNPVTRPGLPEL